MRDIYGQEIKFDPNWYDEHNRLTGLVPWAIENLKDGTEHHTVLPGDFDPRFSNHIVRISRFKSGPLQPAVAVEYFSGSDDDVVRIRITEREMTLYKVPSINTPWRVYRPMLESDGSIVYKLFREHVVNRYAPEGCPAFVNYLLQRVVSLLWRFLENDARFNDLIESSVEDFINDNFEQQYQEARTISDYNDVRTTEQYVYWFNDLQAFVKTNTSTDHSLETLAEHLRIFGKRFADIAADLPDRFPEGSPECPDDDCASVAETEETITA